MQNRPIPKGREAIRGGSGRSVGRLRLAGSIERSEPSADGGVYGIVKTHLRVILPLMIGALSLPLVIWDIHNARVILSVGMGWDTGPPLWPYQTPEILLWFINFPAHVIAQPLANLIGLVVPKHHLLLFPFTLLWWWLVGLEFDRGLPTLSTPQRWVVFSTLVAVDVLLLWAGLANFNSAFRWWFQYGAEFWSTRTLMMVRFLTPTFWCVALASTGVVAAKRVAAQITKS